MNRDDIIRMVDAASGGKQPDGWGVMLDYDQLERFANLVAEHEREECIKVVQEWLHGDWHKQGVVAACMIRERGAP